MSMLPVTSDLVDWKHVMIEYIPYST